MTAAAAALPALGGSLGDASFLFERLLPGLVSLAPPKLWPTFTVLTVADRVSFLAERHTWQKVSDLPVPSTHCIFLSPVFLKPPALLKVNF